MEGKEQLTKEYSFFGFLLKLYPLTEPTTSVLSELKNQEALVLKRETSYISSAPRNMKRIGIPGIKIMNLVPHSEEMCH